MSALSTPCSFSPFSIALCGWRLSLPLSPSDHPLFLHFYPLFPSLPRLLQSPTFLSLGNLRPWIRALQSTLRPNLSLTTTPPSLPLSLSFPPTLPKCQENPGSVSEGQGEKWTRLGKGVVTEEADEMSLDSFLKSSSLLKGSADESNRILSSPPLGKQR